MNTLAYISGFPADKPIIHFYAIAILIGALFALFLGNYHARKDGFSWHFFDSIFLVAFPCGIIGARIWYVIASWQTDFAGQSFWHVFEIWKGGLAIQGGALFGILGGVLVGIFRRKGTSILRMMDYAIPGILVAQAIGRWGNFFNQEVFGHAVLAEAWNFLPGFITNNMTNGTSSMIGGNVVIPPGGIAAPLFLVEGALNVAFYFLIAHGIPAIEGKHFRHGDSSFGYFIAYGLIRMALEPLRNPQFIMGEGSDSLNKATFKSYSMAIAFIVIGILLIALNHVLYHFASKGKFDKIPFLKSIFIEEKSILTLAVEENGSEGVSASIDPIDISKLKEKEEEMRRDDEDEENRD